MSRASRDSQTEDDHRFLGMKERLLQHSLAILENTHVDFFIYGHRHHLKDMPLQHTRKTAPILNQDMLYWAIGLV